MTEQRDVIRDLTADAEQLDALVAHLDAEHWALPTPAPGWSVAHQIAHLAAVFRMIAMATGDPAAFAALTGRPSFDVEAYTRAASSGYLLEPFGGLFPRWRTERDSVARNVGALPADQPVRWLDGRSVPVGYLAGVAMTELFAHGQDVADGLGTGLARTDRLYHTVALAVGNRDLPYRARGLEPPEEFRFEITAPSGAVWAFGPPGASQRIAAPAEDFCLLATRRRHPADLDVVAEGEHASRWLGIAQAYRGTAGEGRAPGQFAPAGVRS